MKGSIIIALLFAAGVLIGYSFDSAAAIAQSDASTYILYAMMLTVGIGIGTDGRALTIVKQMGIKVLALPAATVIGTAIGTVAVSVFISRSCTEALLVTSGYGYYSLSSVLITDIHGAELGTVALISNIIRELAVILTAPILLKAFGTLAPISAAGATSLDTALPTIARYCGKEAVAIAMLHGLCFDIIVPLMIALLS